MTEKNLVFKGNGSQALTNSLLVADKFGKEHKRVMQDIRELGCSEEFGKHNFVLSSYLSSQNKEIPMYILTRDGFTLLAMGYTGENAMKFKEQYINAFNKMEQEIKSQFKVPTSFREALLLAAEQQEIIEKQQLLIEEQQPKAEFFDAVADSKDAISIGELAKVLGIKGMGRNNLFEFLREQKILMNDNVPYQRYQDMGLFRVIEQKYMKNGEPCMNIKTLVYQKGVDYIRKLINNKKIE